MRTRNSTRSAVVLCIFTVSVFALAGCGVGRFGAARPAVTASPAAATPAGQPVVPGGAVVNPYVRPIGSATDGTVTVSGTVRTYRLYVPAGLPDGRAVPLLVALHGGLGNGAQFEQQTGFDSLAQANKFIVVYPNGTPVRRGLATDVWNAGACCSVAAQNERNVNDTGFISALITQLEGRYDIDHRRVFVTGHSNGAMLGGRLACQLSGQIAAIAVQSGTLVTSPCDPRQPVAVLEIHGTADQNVPINGGVGSAGLNKEDYPPPVDGLSTLARRDGCPTTPTAKADPANRAVTVETWQPGRDGTVVEWVKVTGADHAWMGHPTSRIAQRLEGGGSPYMGFDSSVAVWSFLAAHPRA